MGGVHVHTVYIFTPPPFFVHFYHFSIEFIEKFETVIKTYFLGWSVPLRMIFVYIYPFSIQRIEYQFILRRAEYVLHNTRHFYTMNHLLPIGNTARAVGSTNHVLHNAYRLILTSNAW